MFLRSRVLIRVDKGDGDLKFVDNCLFVFCSLGMMAISQSLTE